MFKCQRCNGQSKPGEKLFTLPIKTRMRYYADCTPPRQGSEIVQEEKVCEECAGKK